MATTTPNFGWTVPTSSDLVKNGAVAIETLGDSIDASLVDLKGGTTGQVLAKATNTDMDFTWTTSAAGIPATIIDAKGDLIAGTAADTVARLAVGANDLLLTAASGESTGLKWTGSWTSFTPTWTNLTVGNGTSVGKYLKIGKQVTVFYKVTFGSTSSMGTNPRVTLPVNVASGSGEFNSLAVTLQESGVGTTFGVAGEYANELYIAVLTASGSFVTAGTINSTNPFTWGASDIIIVQATYEVA